MPTCVVCNCHITSPVAWLPYCRCADRAVKPAYTGWGGALVCRPSKSVSPRSSVPVFKMRARSPSLPTCLPSGGTSRGSATWCLWCALLLLSLSLKCLLLTLHKARARHGDLETCFRACTCAASRKYPRVRPCDNAHFCQTKGATSKGPCIAQQVLADDTHTASQQVWGAACDALLSALTALDINTYSAKPIALPSKVCVLRDRPRW